MKKIYFQKIKTNQHGEERIYLILQLKNHLEEGSGQELKASIQTQDLKQTMEELCSLAYYLSMACSNCFLLSQDYLPRAEEAPHGLTLSKCAVNQDNILQTCSQTI